MQTTDLVLEGGGVKGAALAGAVSRLTQDYEVHRVAGTSAGAIVAGLVAAGQQHRLEELMVDTDFRSFLDPGLGGRVLGAMGRGLDVMLNEGMYKGEALHRWIERTLADAGVRTWGDLRMPGSTRHTAMEERYRLVVVVSDVSRGRMLRLPWDAERLFGESPDRMLVATAIRASASIPFFFRPTRMAVDPRLAGGRRSLVLTDGGMLSNYPIGLFDGRADLPTVGVKLSSRLSLSQQRWNNADDPLSLAKALVATMANAHDQVFVDQESVASRTVFVDTHGVCSTDFDIAAETKRAMYDSGWQATQGFLAGWDFEAWRRRFGRDAEADDALAIA